MTSDPNQPYSSYPAQPAGNGKYSPARGGDGLAIAGLVCGIAGLVCGIVGLIVASVILGVLAIVFGSIGLNRARRGAPYRGRAIAGLVLGIVDIVLSVILLAVMKNRGFLA